MEGSVCSVCTHGVHGRHTWSIFHIHIACPTSHVTHPMSSISCLTARILDPTFHSQHATAHPIVHISSLRL